ncbi:MAG: YbaB/EbfC family nucleoid-associated protein [Solobacterium sp.]|nr:YbaB/EbfC family nucleoid-associated protein [Solobacterium sp.]
MDMQRLMQQAQQMQRKLAKIEAELDAKEYEGSNNGVVVRITGKNEVIAVEIPEELMNPDDREELQDMILLAANSALSAASQEREEKMGAITQGVRMPGM